MKTSLSVLVLRYDERDRSDGLKEADGLTRRGRGSSIV